MFHTHNFVEVERFYAEPIPEVNRVQIGNFEKEKFGQTTILYKCNTEVEENMFGKSVIVNQGCGKTIKQEILGKSLK